MTFNLKQQAIHERAIQICSQYFRAEADIITILIEAEREKVDRASGKNSLFQYSVDALRLTESVAYAFIAVARKSAQIPALLEAISANKITMSKASRMVSVLDEDNADDLITFASERTSRELDFEVARRNPRARQFDRAKPISGDLVEVMITMTVAEYEELNRSRALLAQKGRAGTLGGDIVQIAKYFNDREDPVRKADRAAKRNEAKAGSKIKTETSVEAELCTNRVPLTNAQKHAVHARDRGRCTYTDADGHRCGTDRWVDIHHIVPVARGGSNEPENLVTLCWAHHDLIHQLQFDLHGYPGPSGPRVWTDRGENLRR